MPNVLLVDDDHAILDINEIYLRYMNYEVQTATSGEQALRLIKSFTPDCIILDICLNDISGLQLCSKLKELSHAPVIFLSCLDSEEDRIEGFIKGGDDYVIKPFSTKELELRIRARMGQTARSGDTKSFGRLSVSRSSGAYVDQVPLQLTAKELSILNCLADAPNQIIQNEQLFETVWQMPPNSDIRAISVHISNLRKKLSEALGNDRMIETVWGIGYRLRWKE